MVFQQGACGPSAGSGLEACGFVPEAFSNKLRQTEFILRGGDLPEPVVLTDLELIGGKAFFRFSHKDTHLCKFLTGRNAYLHPLANTYLGELLAQLRDERLLSLACAALVEDEVVIDDLGLDDGPPASATSSSEQLPSHAFVAWASGPRSGSTRQWKFNFLSTAPRRFRC